MKSRTVAKKWDPWNDQEIEEPIPEPSEQPAAHPGSEEPGPSQGRPKANRKNAAQGFKPPVAEAIQLAREEKIPRKPAWGNVPETPTESAGNSWIDPDSFPAFSPTGAPKSPAKHTRPVPIPLPPQKRSFPVKTQRTPVDKSQFPQLPVPLSYSSILSGQSKQVRSGKESGPWLAEPRNEVNSHQVPFTDAVQTWEVTEDKQDIPAPPAISNRQAKKLASKNKPSKSVVLTQFIVAEATKPKPLKSKEKKDTEKPVTKDASKDSGNQKKVHPSKLQVGNQLDSSVPVFHKGKTRETEKKKLSTTKKIILREKAEKNENEDITEEKPEPFPKPDSKKFRKYCENIVTKELDEAVIEVLKELARFQDRVHQKEPTKARQKRRLVCGLREVNKLLSVDKMKCVIVAPNIDKNKSEGGLDDQIKNILDTCAEKGIPYLFALTKRKLAAALLKHINVSCVGIINFQGAEEQYKKMSTLAAAAKESYAKLNASRSVLEAAVDCKPFVPTMKSKPVEEKSELADPMGSLEITVPSSVPPTSPLTSLTLSPELPVPPFLGIPPGGPSPWCPPHPKYLPPPCFPPPSLFSHPPPFYPASELT